MLVLFASGLAAAQAHDVVAPPSSALTESFLRTATAEVQASSAIAAVVDAGAPDGLSRPEAQIPAEPVRAQASPPAPPAVSRVVVVQEGQSLWSIASAWGVSVETIAAANDLANVKLVHPGQRLVVPLADDPAARAKVRAAAPAGRVQSSTGARAPSQATGAGRTRSTSVRRPAAGSLTVTLREGQTLWSLARTQGVSVAAIAEANGLLNADRVRAGTRLVIPGRAATARSATRVTTARTERVGEAFTEASATAVRVARGFLWPARGRLTSRFGWRRWRHHDGIDIAAPYGSPIYAGRPGRVVFAGWYHAYGRAVIMDHGDGLQTLYGHASKLLVRTGQTVGQGQLIARVGSSGRSTGPHLHFEVRVQGRAVNPMKYMQ